MDHEHGKGQQPLSYSDLKKRRQDILEIARRHGAHDISVFGSVATGRARPDSDVDLLVDMDSNRTVLDLCDFILDMEHLLGCPVHVVERRYLRPSGANILQDARSL